MAPDVSVIVVTYDARDHVDRCLDAVTGAGGAGVELEVIVVDNDSSDGTADHVRERFPGVNVIEAGSNGGMAAGNNIGMRAASGRAFLLLNSDAFLEPGSVRIMLDRLERDGSGVAAVAPMLRNTDGSHQRSIRGFPTVWRYATELCYLRRLAPCTRMFNAFYGGGIDPARPGWIDWATGACLLVPREAVDEVGVMDESFFMYGEEVEWLHRMARHGRRVAWEPAARVVHVGGGSARREWGRMYSVQLANHVRVMARLYGSRSAARTRRLLIVTLRLRSVLWRLLSLVPGEAADVRRRRSRAFASGVAAARDVDPAAPGPPSIPAWPGVERSAPASR